MGIEQREQPGDVLVIAEEFHFAYEPLVRLPLDVADPNDPLAWEG